MVKTTNIYIKNFSTIPNVQEQEQILYNLCKTNSQNIITYGVEIVSKKRQGQQQCTLSGLSNIETRILDILKFLYENSIKPDSAPGVISDIFNL